MSECWNQHSSVCRVTLDGQWTSSQKSRTLRVWRRHWRLDRMVAVSMSVIMMSCHSRWSQANESVCRRCTLFHWSNALESNLLHSTSYLMAFHQFKAFSTCAHFWTCMPGLLNALTMLWDSSEPLAWPFWHWQKIHAQCYIVLYMHVFITVYFWLCWWACWEFDSGAITSQTIWVFTSPFCDKCIYNIHLTLCYWLCRWACSSLTTVLRPV